MKKGCLTTFLIVLAIPAAFFAWILYASNSAAVQANELLTQIAAGDLDAVYKEASSFYRTHHSSDDFKQLVAELELSRFESCTWKERSADEQVKGVQGAVSLKDGTEKEVELQFVVEDGQLRLFAFGTPRIAARDQIPDTEELKQQILKTFQAFDDSVVTKDFEPLFQTTSQFFRKDYSTEQLTKQFQFLIDQRASMKSMVAADIQLSDEPVFEDKNVLKTSGTAVHSLFDYSFEFRYIHEAGDWRLIGFNFQSQVRGPIVADQFLELVMDDRCEDALDFGSTRLRKEGADRLRARLNELGLIDIQEVEWDEQFRFRTSGKKLNDQMQELLVRGDVVVEGERTVTIDLLMVVEDDEWRVDQLLMALPDMPVIGMLIPVR